MTLHTVLQGLSPTDCDWSLPAKIPQTYQKPSTVESNTRRELLEELVFWYFESFLLPLLKVTYPLSFRLLTHVHLVVLDNILCHRLWCIP